MVQRNDMDFRNFSIKDITNFIFIILIFYEKQQNPSFVQMVRTKRGAFYIKKGLKHKVL